VVPAAAAAVAQGIAPVEPKVEAEKATLPAITSPLPAPTPEPPPELPARPLTPEEIRALDEAAQKVAAADANSFWEAVLADAEVGGVRPDALSWEQAQKLGLVPKGEEQ